MNNPTIKEPAAVAPLNTDATAEAPNYLTWFREQTKPVIKAFKRTGGTIDNFHSMLTSTNIEYGSLSFLEYSTKATELTSKKKEGDQVVDLMPTNNSTSHSPFIKSAKNAQNYQTFSLQSGQNNSTSVPNTQMSLPTRCIKSEAGDSKTIPNSPSTMLHSKTCSRVSHAHSGPQQQLSLESSDPVKLSLFPAPSPMVRSNRIALDVSLNASVSSPSAATFLSDPGYKSDQVDPIGSSPARLFHRRGQFQEDGENSKITAHSPNYSSTNLSRRRFARSYERRVITAGDLHHSSLQADILPTIPSQPSASVESDFKPNPLRQTGTTIPINPRDVAEISSANYFHSAELLPPNTKPPVRQRKRRPAFMDAKKMEEDIRAFNGTEHLGTSFNFQSHYPLIKEQNGNLDVTDEELAKRAEIILGPFATPKEGQTQIGNFVKEGRKDLKQWMNMEKNTAMVNRDRDWRRPFPKPLTAKRKSDPTHSDTWQSSFTVAVDPMTVTGRRGESVAGTKTRKNFPRDHEEGYSRIVNRGVNVAKTMPEKNWKSSAEALGSLDWTRDGENPPQTQILNAETVIRRNGCSEDKEQSGSQAGQGMEKQKDAKQEVDTSAKARTPSLSVVDLTSESEDEWDMIGPEKSHVSWGEEDWIDVQVERP